MKRRRVVGSRRWASFAARRVPAQGPPQVAAFVDAIARGLRSGHSLHSSFAMAAAQAPQPLAAEVRTVVARIDAGVSMRDATADARGRTANDALRSALSAVAIASEAGGANASAFDSLAGALRARAAAAHEVRMLATPVRWSASLIAAAPVGVLGLVALVDAGSLERATSSLVGKGSIGLGVGLDLLGWWWIRLLTRVEP